jgi:hypothetical protein
MVEFPAVPGIKFMVIPGFDKYAIASNGEVWHLRRSWKKMTTINRYGDGERMVHLRRGSASDELMASFRQSFQDGLTMTEKPAKGVKGILIRSNMKNLDKLYFRVYTSEDKMQWVDYDIAHCDLKITIDDGSASLFSDGTKHGFLLDYSSRNLDSDKKSD